METSAHRSVQYRTKAIPRQMLRRVLRGEQAKIYQRFAESFPPRPEWRVLEVGTNGTDNPARRHIGQAGFTYPGLEEMAGKFNLPSRIFPQVSIIGLFVGPVMVLLASVAASIYPALRIRRLEPVEAMRAA